MSPSRTIRSTSATASSRRRADRFPAQHVGPRRGAEVEVGDECSPRHRPVILAFACRVRGIRGGIDSPAGNGERHLKRSQLGRRGQRLRNRRREPGDRRDAGERPGALGGRGRGSRRAGAPGAAGLGRGRLRGARRDPDGGARLDGRQRGTGGRDDLRGDGPPRRRDAVRRTLLRDQRARVLGEARARLPRRRGDRVRLAVRARRPADEGPLRAGRGRRRDRSVELPAQQLVRRLHSGARRRQRDRPQAVGDHPAHVAADGGDAGRGRSSGGRLRASRPDAARPERRWSTWSTT